MPQSARTHVDARNQSGCGGKSGQQRVAVEMVHVRFDLVLPSNSKAVRLSGGFHSIDGIDEKRSTQGERCAINGLDRVWNSAIEAVRAGFRTLLMSEAAEPSVTF